VWLQSKLLLSAIAQLLLQQQDCVLQPTCNPHIAFHGGVCLFAREFQH
jgi:hypothetical protein